MEKEFNKNTRTLIVSFVFALMVLVPLRFVEVGNYGGQATVLGDSISFSEPKLEAPYDQIDSVSSCLTNEYVDKVILFLNDEKKISSITAAEKANIDVQIDSFESRRCR